MEKDPRTLYQICKEQGKEQIFWWTAMNLYNQVHKVAIKEELAEDPHEPMDIKFKLSYLQIRMLHTLLSGAITDAVNETCANGGSATCKTCEKGFIRIPTVFKEGWTPKKSGDICPDCELKTNK